MKACRFILIIIFAMLFTNSVAIGDVFSPPVMVFERGLGPVVVKANNIYMMYYSYRTSYPPDYQTYLATSIDGVTWTSYSDNPVLGVGSWHAFRTSVGSVIFENGTYKMWFTGRGSSGDFYKIGYATSPDGFSWTPYPTPVFEKASQMVYAGQVFKLGNIYYMYYSTADTNIGGPTSAAYLARSTDGINWEDDPANPIAPTWQWLPVAVVFNGNFICLRQLSNGCSWDTFPGCFTFPQNIAWNKCVLLKQPLSAAPTTLGSIIIDEGKIKAWFCDNSGVSYSTAPVEDFPPTIYSIVPNICNPGQIVTINGSNFGVNKGLIKMGGSAYWPNDSGIISWTDNLIEVRIRKYVSWPSGKTQVRNVLIGRKSGAINFIKSNEATLTVIKP